MDKAAIIVVGTILFFPMQILGVHLPPDCPPTVSPAPTETMVPSPSPSQWPTFSIRPSSSLGPSGSPTLFPTTSVPSDEPTETPTESPAPSPSPSDIPTNHPSAQPSVSQLPSESIAPSKLPSSFPSDVPSLSPSEVPSKNPSAAPTSSPSITPIPTQSPSDSLQPSAIPSDFPTITAAPTQLPSRKPSMSPSASNMPSTMPSSYPTTSLPSSSPSDLPTFSPSAKPTISRAPTLSPTITPQPTTTYPPSNMPSPDPTGGATTMMIEGVGIFLEDVLGEMESSDINHFEVQCIDFLNARFPRPTSVMALEFEVVTITNQSLTESTTIDGFKDRRNSRRKTMELYSLRVTFRVLVTVLPGNLKGLSLGQSLNAFFDDASTVEEFRAVLDGLSPYFAQFRLAGPKSGSASDGPPFRGAAYGASAGVLMSVFGSMAAFVWCKRRRAMSRNDDFKYGGQLASDSMGSTEANSKGVASHYLATSTGSSETISGMPSSTVYEASRYNGLEGGSIYPLQSVETSLMVEPGVRSYRHDAFSPTLIQFETNIEVPITPAAATPKQQQYDMAQFDPEDPDIELFSGGNQTDQELKRIFQAWNAEVNASGSSGRPRPLPSTLTGSKGSGSNSGSNSLGSRMSGINSNQELMGYNGRKTDTSVLARSETEEGIETITVFSSDGDQLVIPVQDAADRRKEDEDDFASPLPSRKKRRGTRLGIAKLLGRSRSNTSDQSNHGGKRQRRSTNDSSCSPAACDASLSLQSGSNQDDDGTESPARLGAAPSPRVVEGSLMDELGYQWTERQQAVLLTTDKDQRGTRVETRTGPGETPQEMKSSSISSSHSIPRPVGVVQYEAPLQMGAYRAQHHGQTTAPGGPKTTSQDVVPSRPKTSTQRKGGRIAEFIAAREKQQQFSPTIQSSRRAAGSVPPASVGARWANRSGHYMSDSSESGTGC